jgi:hypothetical protein
VLGLPSAGITSFKAFMSIIEDVKMKKVMRRKPKSTIGVMSTASECTLRRIPLWGVDAWITAIRLVSIKMNGYTFSINYLLGGTGALARKRVLYLHLKHCLFIVIE